VSRVEIALSGGDSARHQPRAPARIADFPRLLGAGAAQGQIVDQQGAPQVIPAAIFETPFDLERRTPGSGAG